ncbi:sensor histidine kinase [Maribacter litoralis]|uniref:sensor histidine kinase n=1 Tax=Maribacter litoralis TaxID=2059726 RepID=UPI000E31695B|nr:sensor histidine kinase [Maribacter litoralis]
MNVIDYKYLETFVFAAIFGVFAIYHLLLFLVLRLKILLYYCIILIGVTAHWSLYLLLLDADNSFSQLVQNTSLTTAMITTFGFLIFTKFYLNITQNNSPGLHKAYTILMYVTITLPIIHILYSMLVGFNSFSKILELIAAITSLTTMVLNIISGIKLFHAEKFNKYYLYSYTPYLLASILYIVTWLLSYFFNIKTDYIILITSILVTLQIILFSILIGFKFKSIVDDNKRIQLDANNRLVYEVDRQTKQLQQAKTELEFQNKELETVNKLKNKIFSLLTHDVRGPLNNVSVLIGLIENELVDTPLKQITAKLKSDVNDRVSMVNTLLDWSYKQIDGVKVSKEQCNLNEVFNAIIKEFEWAAKDKNISIEQEILCQTIFIDQNMLKVILRNLLSNAIKFSENGKKIILSSQCTSDIVELKVKDFGLGMNTDWKNSSESNHGPTIRKGTIGEKGTGFGLMITKDFVEMNDGIIHCKSEINKGTEFILQFKNTVQEPPKLSSNELDDMLSN